MGLVVGGILGLLDNPRASPAALNSLLVSGAVVFLAAKTVLQQFRIEVCEFVRREPQDEIQIVPSTVLAEMAVVFTLLPLLPAAMDRGCGH